MNIGQRLFELRKAKQLSQEEVAEKLNVTRQTVSKWETDQSTPDFDKIVPICNLYEITADELFNGQKEIDNLEENEDNTEFVKRKKAKNIGKGILLYFIGIVWIMISVPVLTMNPVIAAAVMLIIFGIATFLIVYTCIIYKNKKTAKEEHESKIIKQIKMIISLITLIIYLTISFTTMAWHVTWILWIIAFLIGEIIKLIFMLKGDENEK